MLVESRHELINDSKPLGYSIYHLEEKEKLRMYGTSFKNVCYWAGEVAQWKALA
jgi:hypothetical protein